MNRLEKFDKIYRKIIAEQVDSQEEMRLGEVKKKTIDVETWHNVKLGDKEYKITNVVVAYTIENDSIGLYEYWGAKGYDEGKNYIVMDDIIEVELEDLANDEYFTLDWKAEMQKSDSEYKDLFKDGFDVTVFKFIESKQDEIFNELADNGPDDEY